MVTDLHTQNGFTLRMQGKKKVVIKREYRQLLYVGNVSNVYSINQSNRLRDKLLRGIKLPGGMHRRSR